MGHSLLRNPTEIIGLIILFFVMLIGILATIKLFQNYRKTKRIPTLYFAIGLLVYLASGFLLIIERVSLSTLGLADLGTVMALIAIIGVGIAGIFCLRFVILTTYPGHDKIFTTIVVFLEATCHGILCIAIILGPPFSNIQNYEVAFTPIVNIIYISLFIPLISVAIITFYSYAFKLRKEDRPNSNRTFWLATGITIFLIGLLGEVAPILPEMLSIPFRILLLIGAFTIYTCFLMPQWFKDKIGWKD